MKVGRIIRRKVERLTIICIFVTIKKSNRLALAFAKCLATHVFKDGSFSRMFADWQENGWCDENGRPSEHRLQYNMNRVLDVIDDPNMRNFLFSATAFRSLYFSNN